MKDFRELLHSEKGIVTIHGPFADMTSRHFEGIDIGTFTLSIQASENHYCDPRETLYDIYEYNEMEVAIFKDKEWCDIRKDEMFANWIHYEEFIERYDGMVGSYVSVEIIQSLFIFIATTLIEPINEYIDSLKEDC